jgi:hypothetical protein
MTIRPIFLFLCGLLAVGMLRVGAAPESMSHRTMTIDGVYVHVISVDLRDQSLLVTAGVALDEPDHRKSFAEFQKDHRPLAQITGTFFDLHSGAPIGDVVVRGNLVCIGSGVGSALVVTADNEAAIIDSPPADGWKAYESVLQGGLRLVRDGQVDVDPEAQGFNDRYMLRKTARLGVGVLPNHQMVMVETGHLLMPQFAEIMIKLGATDAMALDGGGSTGISFDGKTIMATGRKLANVLMVVQRPPEEVARRAEETRRRAQQALRLKESARRRGFWSFLSGWRIDWRFPDLGALWQSWFGKKA